MKELLIHYDNENGERIAKSYDFLFNFTDDIESDEIDIPMMDYQNVQADFRMSKTKYQRKSFATIKDLYTHCKIMMAA